VPISKRLEAGTSADFVFQVMLADGTEAIGVFLGTDTLTGKVWPGGDHPTTFAPTVTWFDADAGKPKITFNNADTATVTPGLYSLQAYAERAGRTTRLLPEGSTLEILPTAGVGPIRPSYIDVDDLKAVAGWIVDLQSPDSHTSFDEQCADARDWVDELVLRNYRGGHVSLLGMHGLALDSWFTGGSRRTSLGNRAIKDWLTQNKLLVTPRVKQICAYYAIHRICEGMLSRGNQYLGLSAKFRFEAETLLASTTFELDVNGDGYGEIPINMSAANTLWS
jgi:hypothetical protein